MSYFNENQNMSTNVSNVPNKKFHENPRDRIHAVIRRQTDGRRDMTTQRRFRKCYANTPEMTGLEWRAYET